jgi:hypothetical protein
MKGWRTHTFTERVCDHHRPMSSANYKNKFVANFKLGRRQYCLGFHPLWQAFRSVYQLTRKPYITGGVALFLGYFWAMLLRAERPISAELIAFQRHDQMQRLRKFLHLSPGSHTEPPATNRTGSSSKGSSVPKSTPQPLLK